MDFRYIKDFFEYKPVRQTDPQKLLERIIFQAKAYLPQEQIDLILEAYGFAKHAHNNCKRLSGEPYIVHPVYTAINLMDLKPDVASIQAALLHDVIEDTPYTYDDIKKTFGEEVAKLCEGLVKVSKIRYKGEDRQLETIKKTFLAMAKDLRVIMIKLADRIHNIQTLAYHPDPEKQNKIALETIKIYVPVAKRLGLYHYQIILENGCFKILHPSEFNRILSHFEKFFGERSKYVSKGIEVLTKLLKKEGIDGFEVKGRVKSPYRTYEKMIRKYNTQDFSKIMDILAFRIVTDNVEDCYQILGIIHKHYTPLIKKIKDYIAIPKFNGYESIHTTILGLFRVPTEIQIRTHPMDEIAEFGIAAHFAYSDYNKPMLINTRQSEWIKKLQKLVEDYTTSDQKEFRDKLNIEILHKSKFLYTPKGDIIEIPGSGSVLDFAFYVHTEVGLRFKSALVNGHIVPISHIPKTGDIVDIKTFRNKYNANKHWYDYLTTSSSKTKLTRFLKQQGKGDLIEKSQLLLNIKLKEIELPKLYSKADLITTSLDEKQLDSFLMSALDQRIKYSQIIKKLYSKEYNNYLLKQKKHRKPKKKTKPKSANVIVDSNLLLNYQLCPECVPKTEDKIISKVYRDGIKVHKLSCIAMKTVKLDKLLEAHRQGEDDNIYSLNITVQIDSRVEVTEILDIIYNMNIQLKQFALHNIDDNKRSIYIEIDVNNPARIYHIINSLKKFGDSLKVIKREII